MPVAPEVCNTPHVLLTLLTGHAAGAKHNSSVSLNEPQQQQQQQSQSKQQQQQQRLTELTKPTSSTALPAMPAAALVKASAAAASPSLSLSAAGGTSRAGDTAAAAAAGSTGAIGGLISSSSMAAGPASSGGSSSVTSVTAAGVPVEALRLRREMRLLASRLAEMQQTCTRLQQVRRGKLCVLVNKSLFGRHGGQQALTEVRNVHACSGCRGRQGGGASGAACAHKEGCVHNGAWRVVVVLCRPAQGCSRCVLASMQCQV